MANDASTATTYTDLATDCWTCGPVNKYTELTKGFADNLSSALHDPMLILFGSLAGLWIVISGIKILIHATDWKEIVKDFIFITITGIILGSQDRALISYVYTSALSIMGSAADTAFSVVHGSKVSGNYTGMAALAASGEQAVAKVFQVAGALIHAGGFRNPEMWIYAAILVLPYVLLVISYSAQIVTSIFRATMVGIFAPFLFMAFAFGWGRGMAAAGAKTLLSTIMVLFASTAALALTIYGVAQVPIKTDMIGTELVNFASITNPQFLVIMFLGWAGTAFMTEGTSIANSIAGTMLTNSAAGTMTAGTSASAFFGAKGSWKAAKFLGPKAAAVAKGAKAAYDKFKNVNTPGGGSE